MKTELLQVRLTAQLKYRAEVRASELGMSLSEYIRFILLKELGEDANI